MSEADKQFEQWLKPFAGNEGLSTVQPKSGDADTPTAQAYGDPDNACGFLNDRFFDGALPACVITFNRRRDAAMPRRCCAPMHSPTSTARRRMRSASISRRCRAPTIASCWLRSCARRSGFGTGFPRQDVVRKYGEKETAILEDNCSVFQWLKFSNFEEAERVSKAMGETLNINHGLGLSSDKQSWSGNYSTGRDRIFTADELMRLPADEQILHIADVGFIHCRKIRQNRRSGRTGPAGGAS